MGNGTSDPDSWSLVLVAVGVLRLRAAEREPVELPDAPPFLLGLELVARELLLLLDWRCLRARLVVLRTAARGRDGG